MICNVVQQGRGVTDDSSASAAGWAPAGMGWLGAQGSPMPAHLAGKRTPPPIGQGNLEGSVKEVFSTCELSVSLLVAEGEARQSRETKGA